MEKLTQLGLLLLMCFQNGFTAELTSVIQTQKGLVQGQILKTIGKSMPYSAFKGIPYGKPPIGNLRFKPPEEPDSWQNVLNATSEPNQCSQIDFLYKNFSGSEDCLYLNVYTPKTSFDGPTDYKPVMVWIYGGAFRNGYINSTLYGPDYLLEHDVVVVAMNYRVGPLGFLALDIPEASGNTGLKDQNMALHWVKRNIAKFGGDPNSVTIFGQSAGAVAVDLHVLSDLSRGLFHRAIAMSGSPLCPWGFATPSKAKARAFELGIKLGIHTSDTRHLLGELRKLPARDIINAAQEMYKIDPPFKPTIESRNNAGDRAFLTECTINKYKSGNFNRVPYITGFTEKETIAYASSVQSLVDMMTFAIDSFSTSLIRLPAVNLIPFLEAAKSGTVKTISDISYGVMNAAILESTDLMFVTGIDAKQGLLSAVDNVPVYYYRLSFDTEYSIHKQRDNIALNGTAHEDDIPYIFRADDLTLPTDPQHPVVLTRTRMTKMWTNFAKHGNPTPDGEQDEDLKIVWPVSGSSGKHLSIGEQLSVAGRPIDGIVRGLKSYLTTILNGISGCPSGILNPLHGMINRLRSLF